jgi:type IV pilus assembly protein PilC
MRAALHTLKILALLAGVAAMAALLVAWLSFLTWMFSLSVPGVSLFALFLFILSGWMTYAYVSYRQGQQDELLRLLIAAVDAKMPLVPALRAYQGDRPSRLPYHVLLMVVMCALFPGSLVIWIWLMWRRFDKRVGQLADLLEDGDSLTDALNDVPGIAPSEVRLAAAVGETTGRLGDCLKRADRQRLTVAWLELVPRVVYPLVVLLFISGITAFLVVTIVPKFKKIFDEFGQKFPTITQTLVNYSWIAADFLFVLPATIFFAAVAGALVIASPAVRWYTPLLGRLYRWEAQGQVLRSLGVLVEAGKPVPESLHFLAEGDELSGPVRKRLGRAAAAAERGEPLAAALRANGLLPKSMVPLVQAAERAGTLPWALAELGEHLGGKAHRIVKRLSLILSPFLVAAVGVVVAFIAVGMFLPLIKLMESLGQ